MRHEQIPPVIQEMFELTVRVPGRAPLVFKDLPCDPKFKYLKLLNFGDAPPSIYYLDNVQVRLREGQ